MDVPNDNTDEMGFVSPQLSPTLPGGRVSPSALFSRNATGSVGGAVAGPLHAPQPDAAPRDEEWGCSPTTKALHVDLPSLPMLPSTTYAATAAAPSASIPPFFPRSFSSLFSPKFHIATANPAGRLLGLGGKDQIGSPTGCWVAKVAPPTPTMTAEQAAPQGTPDAALAKAEKAAPGGRVAASGAPLQRPLLQPTSGDVSSKVQPALSGESPPEWSGAAPIRAEADAEGAKPKPSYLSAVKYPATQAIMLDGVAVKVINSSSAQATLGSQTNGSTTLGEEESVISSWADDDECFLESLRITNSDGQSCLALVGRGYGAPLPAGEGSKGPTPPSSKRVGAASSVSTGPNHGRRRNDQRSQPPSVPQPQQRPAGPNAKRGHRPAVGASAQRDGRSGKAASSAGSPIALSGGRFDALMPDNRRH